MLIVDPQTYDLTLDAGDQEKLKFSLFNADGTPYAGGSGIIAFIAKLDLDDAIGAAVMNIISNVQVGQWDMTNWNTGIAILEFVAANSNTLGGKRLVYAAKVTDATSKIHTPRSGLMTIRKNPGL